MEVVGLFTKYGIIIQVFFVSSYVVECLGGNVEESCVLSFVVPKDSIKNSCNAEHKFANKIRSLESVVRTLQQHIGQLQEKVTATQDQAPTRDDIYSGQISLMNLEERFEILETKVDKLVNLNQSQNENSIIKTLLNLIKPYIQDELHRIGTDILHNVRKASQGRQLRSRTNSLSYPADHRSYGQHHNGRTRGARRTHYTRRNNYGNPDIRESALDELEVESGEGFLPVYNNPRETQSVQEPELLRIKTEDRAWVGTSNANSESDLWNKIHENVTMLLQNHTIKINRISSNYKSIIESKLKHLIQIILQMQRNHQTDTSAIQSAHNSTKDEINLELDAIRTEIRETVTRVEVLQESILSSAKSQVDIQNIVSEIQSLVEKTTSRSMRSLSSKVEAQKHKITMIDAFVKIFQQTLRHYGNESIRFKAQTFEKLNSSYSKMELEVNKLAESLKQMNSSKFNNTDLRLLEVEEHIHLLDAASFDTREEITSLQNRFRSEYFQVNSIMDTLRNQIASAVANQLSLNTTMENILHVFRKLQAQIELDENSWAEYNFIYTGENSECFGKHYIRKKGGPSSQLVGVILCTSDKYKIVLGESLEGIFLDIGDQRGFGEDHCEFVGATSEYGVEVGQGNMLMDSTEGYRRKEWGEQVRVGVLSFLTPSPPWYRCGITIP